MPGAVESVATAVCPARRWGMSPEQLVTADQFMVAAVHTAWACITIAEGCATVLPLTWRFAPRAFTEEAAVPAPVADCKLIVPLTAGAPALS